MTGKIKHFIKQESNEKITQSKTVMISSNKNDNINDVLISDNELDESKNDSNIKKRNF